MNFSSCFRDILNDLRVELSDEFDRNFERGSFFGTQKWPRSTRPGAKSPLVDSGALRRSIRGRVSGNSVSFSSSLPYASIHNEGGIITVTTRMKRYFWARHIESTGKITRAKTGKTSKSKRNTRLSEKATFYKATIERDITDFLKANLPEGKDSVRCWIMGCQKRRRTSCEPLSKLYFCFLAQLYDT